MTTTPLTKDGTDRDDVLRFADETRDLIIRGFGGDDILEGGTGDDTAEGGDGDDIFIPGLGDDGFVGGDGHDTYDASDLASVDGELGGPFAFILAFGGIVTKGTLGVDLIGTFDLEALDVEPIERVVAPLGIEGNLLDLSVQAAEQEPSASAIVDLEEEFVTLFFGPIAGGLELFTIEVVNFDDVIGTNFGGVLVGDHQDNVINGREGSDQITGRLGADTLAGDRGADRFIDTAEGLDGDTLVNFAEGDVVTVRDRDFDENALDYDQDTGLLTIATGAHDEVVTLTFAEVPDARFVVAPSTVEGATDIRFEGTPVVHVDGDAFAAGEDGLGLDLDGAGVEAGHWEVTVAWRSDHHGGHAELAMDGETMADWSLAHHGGHDHEGDLAHHTLAAPLEVIPGAALELRHDGHGEADAWLEHVTFTQLVGADDVL